MKRREFVRGAGVAAVCLFAARARAQPAKMAVVGYLSSKGSGAEAATIAATREGLARDGFIEGRNLAIETRFSDGDYARLPALADDLVARNVRVIITSGLPATLAAKKATSTIPIVFRLAVDPVAFGLVQSTHRPGGNITGATMLFDPLTPKKVQLLHELVPSGKTLGLLVNPKNQNAASHQAHAVTATRDLGLRLAIVTASTPAEFDAAFVAAKQQGVAAVLVGDDPFFDTSNRELVATAARHKVPTMYYVRDFVDAGGLISYGPNFAEMATIVGDYAARVLKGGSPASLPVTQPTRFETVINLKTAKALDLAVPPLVLTQADEVIE